MARARSSRTRTDAWKSLAGGHSIPPCTLPYRKMDSDRVLNWLGSACGTARTELKMWCAIVVNRGLTTIVKHQHREKEDKMWTDRVYCVYCTECVVKRSLSQEWNGRSDRQYVLSTYCGVTVPLSLGDRSDNQNMYVHSVRMNEWAQGGMRSMVHGGMWGFTH